jgi:hypothetical protein
MAARKRRAGDKTRLAPRGDAAGFARIRMWTNALETAMIERYVGNAPTLKPMAGIVKGTLRAIKKIKPMAISDCPSFLVHAVDCTCGDPYI